MGFAKKRKLRILCDMDGILADCAGGFFEWVKILHGVEGNPYGLDDFDFAKHPPFVDAELSPTQLYSIFDTPNFFAGLRPIHGALYSLAVLAADKHEIQIVTAVPKTAASEQVKEEKARWLSKHLPYHPFPVQYVSADLKANIEGDVLIEDRPSTLQAYAKAHPKALTCGILYPYNRKLQCVDGIKLANNCFDTTKAWDEIVCWIDGRAYGKED